MTRLILILLTIFMVLTILKHFIRNYRKNSMSAKKTYQEPKSVKDKKHNDDENIIDAKFEEIK